MLIGHVMSLQGLHADQPFLQAMFLRQNLIFNIPIFTSIPQLSFQVVSHGLLELVLIFIEIALF